MSVKEYTTDPVRATQRAVTLVSGVIELPMDDNYVINPAIVRSRSPGFDHTGSYIYSTIQGNDGATVDVYLTDHFDEFLYGNFLIHDNGVSVSAGDDRGMPVHDETACPYVTCYNHTVRTVPNDSDFVSKRGRKASVLSLKFVNLINGYPLTPLALGKRPTDGGGFKELHMMLWFRKSGVA